MPSSVAGSFEPVVTPSTELRQQQARERFSRARAVIDSAACPVQAARTRVRRPGPRGAARGLGLAGAEPLDCCVRVTGRARRCMDGVVPSVAAAISTGQAA